MTASSARPTTAPEVEGDREAPRPAHRVVWQVVDGGAEAHERLLRQVANLQADLPADAVRIEVVAHGAGLDLLLPSGQGADQVRTLRDAGVDFVACENTLRSRGLALADLVEGARSTPSAIGHLVRRQTEGWAYLRA